VSTSYDVMPDFTHDAVGNVPDSNTYKHIAGYTSGTEGILWTTSDWDKYPNAVHIRIEQGYGTDTPNMADYDVLDVEQGAWTPTTAAAEVKRRVEAGYVWTTLYGSDGTLESCATLIKAMGDEIWVGHVDCVLANWNLTEAQAVALIGTQVAGMTCRGVQWASPKSNPKTSLPGTTLTLSQADVDLNVVQSSWKPVTVPRGTSAPVTPPAPPVKPPVVPPVKPPVEPVVQLNHAGLVVWQADGKFYTREVASADGGKSWV
jgi:hypothetical protein